MRTVETVPCKVCGKPTHMLADRRCTNCWEVETRLELYLRSQTGRELVKKLLAEVETLAENEKKFLAIAIQSICMKYGPPLFGMAAQVAGKLNLEKELEESLRSWLNYAQDEQQKEDDRV